MNLVLKPYHKNTNSLYGFLVKGKDIYSLLDQLNNIKIDLANTPVFAIPDLTPNSIWGFFVATELKTEMYELMHHFQICQTIQQKLFFPELSIIHPKISDLEINTLFSNHAHILHPEFGLFELENSIDFISLLSINKNSEALISKPFNTPYLPQFIKKIDVKSLPPDQLLENMEENMFPQKESLKDEPLNWKEKIKYTLLKQFFAKDTNQNPSQNNTTEYKDTGILSMLKSLFPGLDKNIDKLAGDFDNLDKRNSSEMEKLMNLFKDNPDEALKYAIPIDNEGVNRGGDKASFTMNQRWSSFSLFGNKNFSSGNGGVILQDNTMMRLQQQYEKSAKDFIQDKKYEKAAFVYMKLLKNNYMAARTLEEGKLYAEAATVYIKYLNNKEQAAICYENGRMISDAITLYKELEKNEKVGDLYITINNKKEAFEHYTKVVDEYKINKQYVKASILLDKKMQNKSACQNLLLDGWRNDLDGFNCINNYFNNIEDISQLSDEIYSIYKNDTNHENQLLFLKALKYEHKKDQKIAKQTRDIAYEIIAQQAPFDPNVLNDIKSFTNDKQVTKDIIRYKN